MHDAAQERKKHTSTATSRKRILFVHDGSDVVLQFGKYQGWKFKDMVADSSARGYLRWVLREDFPQDLKDLCSKALTLYEIHH
jgi:uncharacterized protein (DUF3820 family)